jgi:hypothetical protein
VVRRVLGRLTDQPGERHECERRQDEQLDIAEVEQEVRGNRERREG